MPGLAPNWVTLAHPQVMRSKCTNSECSGVFNFFFNMQSGGREATVTQRRRGVATGEMIILFLLLLLFERVSYRIMCTIYTNI